MNEFHKPDPRLMKLLPPAEPRPGVAYKPSQFALPFECGGKQYVFSTLTKQCVEAALPASAHAGEGYDELIRGLFLVPEDRDETAFYQSIVSLLQLHYRRKDFSGYIILPTLGCNARCVYCFEEGRKRVNMAPETVEQVIRFIVDTHQGDEVILSWFGGEPLLCPGVIDRVCAGMREAGIKYQSAMVSNGSLITPEILEKMTGDWALRSIQISMDGAEEDYIARKRYAAYHDYYHEVMKAVSRMSEAGISVSIRSNVDEKNWDGITRFLKDLEENVRHKERVEVYFSPLHQVRGSDAGPAMWNRIAQLRRAIGEAGFKGGSAVTGLGQSLRLYHCMTDGGGVAIGPDGSLYCCEECTPASRFGDVWHGVTDEKARRDFCRTDILREKCRGCAFLPYCTHFAGCPNQEKRCREVHHDMTLHALRALIEENVSLEAGEHAPIC